MTLYVMIAGKNPMEWRRACVGGGPVGVLLDSYQAGLGVQVERARGAEPAQGGAVARRPADGRAVPGGCAGPVRLRGAHHKPYDRSGMRAFPVHRQLMSRSVCLSGACQSAMAA